MKLVPSADALRLAAQATLAWAAWLFAIHLLAGAVAQDPAFPKRPGPLHGFIDDLRGEPPLARWDSVWYYEIALHGYHGPHPASRYSTGFLPLYPALARGLAELTGLGILDAASWVTRLALLAALGLLVVHARAAERSPGAGVDAGWAAAFALVCFPSAFVLASVYPESLFLALSLAAFVGAERGRPWGAAVAAFFAALTRIHGMALIPAFAVWALMRWRAGERRAAVLAPLAGVLLAYACLGVYFAVEFDDPLRYFHDKQENWTSQPAWPWETIGDGFARLDRALAAGSVGEIYTIFELPTLALLAFAAVARCQDRRWHEAAYVAAIAFVSLLQSSLWGLPRFALGAFPAFCVLAELRGRPYLWLAVLAGSASIQGALLVNYVQFAAPAP